MGRKGPRRGAASPFGAGHGPGRLGADRSRWAILEEATRRLYSGLLDAAEGLHLYRIWNCVPSINPENAAGLENYRAFCRGRALAFEKAFGRDFARRLPASSAVGTAGGALTIVFLAGERPARHFENPAQVPAYEYPPEHGPRPPSFARATVVEAAPGLDAFISGTSAIMGHSTVAPHDTAGQLDCTLENLRLVFRACGLGPGAGPAAIQGLPSAPRGLPGGFPGDGAPPAGPGGPRHLPLLGHLPVGPQC